MGIGVSWSGNVMDVYIDGLDRVFGQRRRLEVPLTRVVEVRVLPRGIAESDISMFGRGLGIPGLIAVGHFRGRTGRRQWWRVRQGVELLVIDLSPDSTFDRVVLEVDDVHTTAAEISRTVRTLQAAQS